MPRKKKEQPNQADGLYEVKRPWKRRWMADLSVDHSTAQ